MPPLLTAPDAPAPHGAEPSALEFADALGFERLYAAFFHHVTRWVRAFGCRSADIDDVAQETFLVARRRLADFDGKNPAGWLYRIAQHVTRAHRRRAWVRRTLFREADDRAADVGQQSPVEALEQRDARRLMQQLLAQLTERRRTTFFLFEIEGYSGEEIAVLEGVSASTVYTRLYHARRDFMALLAAAEAEEGRTSK